MDQDIESAYGDFEASEDVAADQAEKQPEEQTAAATETEPGTEKGEDVEASPATEESDAQSSTQVPLAALKEERRKRQELERRVQQLQDSFIQRQAQQQAPASEPEKDLDLFDDPEGYIERRTRAIEERFWQRELAKSVAMAKRNYADYTDAENAFVEAARENPTLAQQMRESADPAEFAYQNGKIILETRGVSSLDDYRQKVREEYKAELLEELKKERATKAANSITATNAGARGSGGRAVVDDSIESLYGTGY